MKAALNSFINWVDQYALFVASIFLLFFIPLYPKIPLFDVLPGYLVRIRLEDIIVGLLAAFWLFQTWRKKIKIESVYFWYISVYAVVGLLSMISAVILLQTIPLSTLHIGKSMLHFFRYIEYFSLFFFAHAGFTKLKQAKIALWSLAAVVLAITVYGYGQLYWQWPLYSTMNREFSKGVKLYLTEHARVQSTFAGHYDLAAYLVLVLPILLSAALLRKKYWEKVAFATAHGAGLWLLVTSESNIALAAYAIGSVTVVLFYLSRYPKIFRFTGIFTAAVFSLCLIIGATVFVVAPNLPLRALQTTEQSPTLMQLPGLPLAMRTTRAMLYPETIPKPDPAQKPADVFHDIPDRVEVATVSATGEISTIIVERDRTWSDNALKYGLSMGIRLDTLWPQALRGWARSLYLGSGYGTLNNDGTREFSDSDSTDNNYLRAIGETGTVGFLAFFVIIGAIGHRLWLVTKSTNRLAAIFAIGALGSISGLLINAVIIDVFVASKVAFTFWAITGIATKTALLTKQVPQRSATSTAYQIWNQLWPLIVGVLCLVILIHKNPLDQRSSTRDLGMNPQTVESLNTVDCWIEQGTWQLCSGEMTAHSSTSRLYGVVLFAVRQFSNNPAVYFYANLLLAIIAFVLLFNIARMRALRPALQAGLLIGTSILLFFLGTTAVPIASNSYLVVLLLGLVLVERTATRFTLHFMLGTTILAAVLAPDISQFLHITAPILLLVLLEQLQHTLKPKYRARMTPATVSIFAGIVASCAVLLMHVPSVSHAIALQVQEYRGKLPALRSLTVERLNQFFDAQKISSGSATDDTPHVITTLDPWYVGLYGNGSYRPLPMTTDQAYFSEYAQAYGLQSPSDLNTLYLDLATRNQLYYIDFATQSPAGQQSFEQLQEKFTLQQIGTECDEQCNLFQVGTTPITIPTQPIALNQVPLSSDPQTEFTAVLYSHRFNFADPVRTHTIVQYLNMLQPISQQQPNLLFLTGDVSAGSDPAQRAYFEQQYLSQVSYPVLNVPGNFDEQPKKLYTPPFQQFRQGNSLFVTIQQPASGQISREQQLFLYNILHQLKKQPDIKQVFFITHRMSWLAGQQTLAPLSAATNQPLTAADHFFTAKFLPKLAKHPAVEFYFVGGDLAPNQITTALYHTEQNIHYVAAAVNNSPNDAYLTLSISPETGVTFLVYSGTHQLLGSIEQFGLPHWQQVVPELSQVETAQPTTAANASTAKKAVSATALSLLVGIATAVLVRSAYMFSAYRSSRK